jgi:flagellar basal-body rod modification protein FlgD
MPIDAVSTIANTAAATPVRQPAQVMDGDAYMELFLASLKNQDPSEPMSSSEMMQSTATLSQMQMLDGLNSTMESLILSQTQSTATSLIGRSVSFVDGATGVTRTGVVDGVSMAEKQPILLIANERVPMGLVSIVSK